MLTMQCYKCTGIIPVSAGLDTRIGSTIRVS